MCADRNGIALLSLEDINCIYNSDIYAHKSAAPGLTIEVTYDKMRYVLADFSINQNFPNPFICASVTKYLIPKSSQVTLKIFNTLGEEFETLVNEEKPVGT